MSSPSSIGRTPPSPTSSQLTAPSAGWYATAGVDWLWFVDPEGKQLEEKDVKALDQAKKDFAAPDLDAMVRDGDRRRRHRR